MSDKIAIRTLTNNDMESVVNIHISAFPKSLFTKLGADCVIKYYEWQLESPDKVYAIGAFDNETMVGYCFGGVFSMATGGFLLRHKALVTKQLISRPWLMFHPAFMRKIIDGFSILKKFSKNKDVLTKAPIIAKDSHFGILAIASSPEARGLGVGKMLIENSEQIAVKNNFRNMFLTVSPRNTNAVQFYEHIGWKKEGNPENWKGEMRKILVNSE